MVSVNPAVLNDRASTVCQSADLAIRDLLVSSNDPFALAVYLWMMRQHDLTLINGDGLASWGANWAYRILINRQIGRRRDEEIVSATLAAAALVGTPTLAGELDEIRTAVGAILVAELDRSLVPFGRLSYAAVLLVAADTIGIDCPQIRQAAPAIGSAFADAVLGGRLFGLDFAVRILQHHQLNGELDALQRAITNALANPRTEYEDKVYLLQALWRVHGPQQATDKIIRQTCDFLDQSPGWLYLMAGIEEVLPAGDGTVAVIVSHLFRTALLDVLLQLRSRAKSHWEREIDKRYRGRRFVGLGAFGFGLVVLALPWIALVQWILPRTESAREFWLLDQYAVLAPASALLFLAACLFTSFLVPFSIGAIWTLWSSLVVSAVESDRRIVEVLMRRTWLISKWWLVCVGLAMIINLMTGIFGPAFQHVLSGK